MAKEAKEVILDLPPSPVKEGDRGVVVFELSTRLQKEAAEAVFGSVEETPVDQETRWKVNLEALEAGPVEGPEGDSGYWPWRLLLDFVEQVVVAAQTLTDGGTLGDRTADHGSSYCLPSPHRFLPLHLRCLCRCSSHSRRHRAWSTNDGGENGGSPARRPSPHFLCVRSTVVVVGDHPQRL